MREFLEQTRYVRARPSTEQAEGLGGRLRNLDTWLRVIGEFTLGLLLAAGIIMVAF